LKTPPASGKETLVIRAGVFSLTWLFFQCVSAPVVSQDLPVLWPDAAEIEEFLKEAKITKRVKIGEGITKPQKVTLELDGKIRHAIYKNVDKKHDSWRFEVAAYQLDKLLRLGMVPPTVERGIRGRRGCFQLWVTGVTMEKYEGTLPDPESWRRQVSVMWLFDDLIANIDRHLNNAMVSPEHRLILIDNSKTFRPSRKLLNDLNGPGTGTHARFWLTEYEKDRKRYRTSYPVDLVERLRELTDKQLKKTLGRYVFGYNKDILLKRRKIILERLAQMGPTVLVQKQ
jgi:hypothetical protein